MDEPVARKPLIIQPGQGRAYPMGRMFAVFKADRAETESKYSVSEWWLDPGCRLPNQHAHKEDHVYYVIEGTLTVLLASNAHRAERGAYVIIPGGALHAFENQSPTKTGFISINVPGGFEDDVPEIAAALALVNPVG